MQTSFTHAARSSQQEEERQTPRTRLFSLFPTTTHTPVSEERVTFALIFVGNCVFWGLLFLWLR